MAFSTGGGGRKGLSEINVTPILQRVRAEAGGAIDPVGAYRASGYRQQVAKDRPAVAGGTGGIV